MSEAERLADAIQACFKDDFIDAAAAELRRLSAELEKVCKDAERYRWLRERGDYRCTEKDGYGGQTLKIGDRLDSAIDAAMKGTP